MRHNRVLSVAIATALSMGATAAYAGKLETGYTTAATVIQWNSPPTFASEYFLSNPIIPDAVGTAGPLGNLYNTVAGAPATMDAMRGNYFYAKYQLQSTLSQNFLAKFELSNGAQFGKDISLATATLDFKANISSSSGGVPTTFTGGGKQGDTQVTFLVQAQSSEVVKLNEFLLLRFQLQKADVLSTPGAKVDMTASIEAGGRVIDDISSDHSPTATVLQSARGAEIKLKPTSGSAEIDVGSGSINFVGGIVSSTIVELGTLEINNTTQFKDDFTEWTFAVDNPVPTAATLTIIDGNFSASQSSGSGKVFLDVTRNNGFDTMSNSIATDDDIAAVVDVDGITATWNLSVDQLKAIHAATGSVPILIQADGSTEINAPKETPLATLSIEYGSAGKDTVSSKLRKIKRNGTVCTLYNIPNPTAIDTGNIRITNTAGKTAKIVGTLRDLNGVNIFTNQVLVEAMAVNETVRLTQVELDGIVKDAKWLTFWQADAAHNPTGGESGWQARATLTIGADTSSMEAFGLVRNKTGGPLTNMSVGGTGNGCD
jgi:hypothetical protein